MQLSGPSSSVEVPSGFSWQGCSLLSSLGLICRQRQFLGERSSPIVALSRAPVSGHKADTVILTLWCSLESDWYVGARVVFKHQLKAPLRPQLVAFTYTRSNPERKVSFLCPVFTEVCVCPALGRWESQACP